MTYITRFSIDGLAGRNGPVDIQLKRSVNILWGLNGSGKTTLLKLLDCALSNTTAGLNRLPFTNARIEFFAEALQCTIVRTYTKPLGRELPSLNDGRELVSVSDQELSRRTNKWTITFDDEDNDGEEGSWSTQIIPALEDALPDRIPQIYRHTFLPTNRFASAPRRVADRTIEDSLDERFVREISRVWTRYNSDSLRSIRAIQQGGLAAILAIIFVGDPDDDVEDDLLKNHVADADEAYTSVAAFLKDQGIRLPLSRRQFRQRYEEGTENARIVARIQETATRVEQVLAPQRELEEVISDLYIGDKALELNTAAPRPGGPAIAVKIADREIPLEFLSSGEKQLLQILLETLAAGPNTIMIDEPELSLHVDWQERLVASMRRINKDAQLILATHSPELMVDVDPRFVFEL